MFVKYELGKIITLQGKSSCFHQKDSEKHNLGITMLLWEIMWFFFSNDVNPFVLLRLLKLCKGHSLS